jgi:signal transduction histidine kinase
MTLAGRMWIASAILAALVGAAFTALILAVDAQRSATAREHRSNDVTVATLQVEKLVVDLETGLRGFTLTANRVLLEPYSNARTVLPSRIARLQQLVEGDPRQRDRVRLLEQRINEYVEDYAEPLIVIVRETPEIARQDLFTEESKRRTDEIRRIFAASLAAERGSAADAAAEAESRADRAVLVGALGIGASTLLIILFGIILARSIGRPVRAVASGASRLAAGDLSLRLPTEGPGEIGELTTAFNDMAGRLEEGRGELQEQNEKLRESERMKTELISIVSHELRTPLASVLGFTSLLLKREFDTPTRRHYLGIVDAQARRLAALLEDFLDMQRMEHEGLDLDTEKVDLASLLDEQAQLYRAQSSKHQLAVAVDERPLPVRGDRNRLAQVVGNLLSNAIKYSPDGGIVSLTAARNGQGVRVTVRDEGLGIPADQQDRIFTKFFRGDAGATGITGTGLGLAVSREIVEAHGGRIGFDSAAGDGSTFWLELPDAPAEGQDSTTINTKETLR